MGLDVAAKDRYVSFKIPVSSITRKGQLFEIREYLKILYPKDVGDNCIFFSKKDRNGEVWVCVIENAKKDRYLSEELWLDNRKDDGNRDASFMRKDYKRCDVVSRYRRSDSIRKTLIIMSLIIFAAFLYLRATERERGRARAWTDERRAYEEARKREQAEAKRIDSRISELEKTLDAIEGEKSMDFHQVMIELFSALEADDRVELLNLKGDEFYMEVGCSDKAEALERLCENPLFDNVVLLRSNRTNKNDQVVFKGKVLKNTIDRRRSLEKSERLEYLELAVDSLRQGMRVNDVTAPEYLRSLENAFDEKSIKEEYTEYVEGFGFRISVSTNASDLISFIRGRNDIRTLHLSFRGRNCMATIEFGQAFSEVGKKSESSADEQKVLSSLSMAHEKNEQGNAKQVARLNYIFIGKARQDGEDYAVFKDASTSKLFRFRIDENLSDDGTCRRMDNGAYMVRIDSKEFEVR